MKRFIKSYNNIVTISNLLQAWNGFLSGKKKRCDVIDFQFRLMDNIFSLKNALITKSYKHGGYQAFKISDPKPREIHKASVSDRLLHHLIYQETHLYFDQKFIHDSYSCRFNKGTYRALNRFVKFAGQASKNNKQTVWVLKCDIRKFFASIDHQILKDILAKYIVDWDLLWLFGQVIDSFNTSGRVGVGLPLGNLTSQLLVNIYMNEFDQFVKRILKIKYYIRYADDFIFLSDDRTFLEGLKPQLSEFLNNHLKLCLHPNKVSLKTLASSIDFLGWVQFGDHRVLRTTTKNRMLKKVKKNNERDVLMAYLGMLKHGNAYKLRQKLSIF
ncbi:MAG: reverse transcriptase/maturase family protein [Patescibacteria group bacterium]